MGQQIPVSARRNPQCRPRSCDASQHGVTRIGNELFTRLYGALRPKARVVPGTTPHLHRSIWLLLHSDFRQTTRVHTLVDFLAAEIKALKPIFLGPLA